MTVPANSLLNLTRPQLPERQLNTRSRHGTNFNYQSRYQEAMQGGQHTYYSNAYPYYYNNVYSGRSRGWGPITNGSHQRLSNRSRGASGSNGYIQSHSHLHARPISQSQASSGATKYNQTHHSYRNSRGSNVNGYSNRGNGSRSGGNGLSRGRGRGDGKT
jgi:hypothetical protein